MPTFVATVADRETGKSQVITLNTDDREQAVALLMARGWLVGEVVELPPTTPPPETVAEIPTTPAGGWVVAGLVFLVVPWIIRGFSGGWAPMETPEQRIVRAIDRLGDSVNGVWWLLVSAVCILIGIVQRMDRPR